MLSSSIPARFGIPWGASAGGAYIRAIPQASQIGITAGAASLTDGWPPATFLPIGAGGTPPFGQDFNGILKQITQWNQWQAAGGPTTFDQTFANAIGGYPKSAVLAGGGATPFTTFWLNQVEGNTANPDTGGANWLAIYYLSTSGLSIVPGNYTRTKITNDQFGRLLAIASGAQPTYQNKTNGTGVVTPSAGVVRWRVRMAAGGGGGNGGAAGGNSSLGGWSAFGGAGGNNGGAPGGGNGAGGAGGTGGANGTGTLVERQAGGAGATGITFTGTAIAGGISGSVAGGLNRLGGGPNSGQGGPGTSSQNFNNSSVITSGAGGAGEYVEFDIINPVTLNFVVGAAGSNAQAGVILIEEWYD
jgi:hypothetical protein